jgi:uncharacterized protein YdgA (DUF945 family)
MRKAFLALVVIVILAALTPFVFGLYTEHYYKRLLTNAQLPQGTYIDLVDYKRGYLKSEASYELALFQNIPGQAIPEQIISIIGHDEILHGPFFLEAPFFGIAKTHSFTTAEDIMLAGIAQYDIDEIFDDEEVIQANSHIGFNGTIDTKLNISGINVTLNDDTRIEWGGLANETRLSKNLLKHYLSVDFAPLRVYSEEKQTIDTSRISLVSDAKRSNKTPWIGEQDLSIPKFYFENKTGDKLRIENFILSADTTMKKDRANFDMSIRAAHFEVLSESINNLNISASLHRLDAESLLRIGQILHDEEILSPRDKQELSQSVIYLFTPGSEIFLDGEAAIDTGNIEASLSVLFPDLSAVVAEESAESLAQTLVMRLEADFNYSVPKETLDDILVSIALFGANPDEQVMVNEETGETKSVKELVKQGVDEEIAVLSNNNIMLTDGDNYTLQLGYDRGAIILNGSRLDQEDIARIMMIFQRTPE